MHTWKAVVSSESSPTVDKSSDEIAAEYQGKLAKTGEIKRAGCITSKIEGTIRVNDPIFMIF